MLNASALLTPTVAQVSTLAPVASVSMVSPWVELQYPFPVAAWLLDVRGLHTIYHEHLQLSDTKALGIEKGVRDAVTLSDTRIYSLASVKADLVGIQDTFNRVCEFDRKFSETVAVSDIKSISLSKPVQDQFLISDTALVWQEKGMFDGIKFGDSQFTKSLISVYRETVGMHDSFFLTSNTYGSGDYFAEDYAGVTRFV